jgi:hypothetical protein
MTVQWELFTFWLIWSDVILQFVMPANLICPVPIVVSCGCCFAAVASDNSLVTDAVANLLVRFCVEFRNLFIFRLMGSSYLFFSWELRNSTTTSKAAIVWFFLTKNDLLNRICISCISSCCAWQKSRTQTSFLLLRSCRNLHKRCLLPQRQLSPVSDHFVGSFRGGSRDACPY